MGNIYASESLFRARIHPETPAKNLSLRQCEKLDSTGKKLEVRGFIGVSLFGRSQTWLREEAY